MKSLNILVIGATSAIAQAIIKQYSTQQTCRFYLLARNSQRLSLISSDLSLRTNSEFNSSVLDANNFTGHAKAINDANLWLGKIDLVIIAHGTLPDQKNIENSFDKIQQEITTNYTSVVSLLTHITPHMQKNKAGSIVVISSVAGDRGRQSNYIYGSAKAALSTYLQGLRNRLYKDNINVLTVKPGFVDTPMTADLSKNFLFAQPSQIAKKIIGAIKKRKDVVYTPFFWRPIMQIIRLIPEKVFKRLSL